MFISVAFVCYLAKMGTSTECQALFRSPQVHYATLEECKQAEVTNQLDVMNFLVMKNYDVKHVSVACVESVEGQPL